MASTQEFAATIKAKYPQYQNIPDADLVQKIVAKYPQYADRVTPDTAQAPVEAPQEQSMWGKAASTVLAPVAALGEGFNRISTYPLNAAIGEIQNTPMNETGRGRDLSQLPGAIGRGLIAGVKQFGRSGEAVQKSADTFRRFEFPEGQAKAAGFLMDLATPVPGVGAVAGVAKAGVKEAGTIAKVAGAAGSETVKAGIKGTAKAVDLLTNTKLSSKAVEIGSDALKSTIDATKAIGKGVSSRYAGKYADDFAKHSETLKRNKINPEHASNAVKFGETSQASKYQRYEMEFLRPDKAKAHDETVAKIQEAVRSDITKIAGGKGASIPNDAAEAGEILRNGFNRKVDDFFDKVDVRYQTVAKDMPNLTIPKPTQERLVATLAKQEKKAQDLLKNSYDKTSKAQAKEFLDAVAQAKAATNSYPALVTALQGIGRTAFKNTAPSGIPTPDKALFRSMYHDLSGVAMETVARRLGKKAAGELAENNKLISEFISDKSVLSVLADPKKSPEKAFRDLIEAGDSVKIKALKRALDPKELQAIKAGFLNEQIASIERSGKDFTFRLLNNRLRNKSTRRAMEALFDKGELDNIRDLIEVGDRMGPNVLSTSGTGASNQIQGIVESVTAPSPKKIAFAGINKVLAKSQESRAAKNAAKASDKVKIMDAPGMNLTGRGRTLADIAGINPRSKAAQMVNNYGPQEEDQ